MQDLQHRRLGLKEAARVQFFAQRPGDGGAQLRHPAGVRVDDQVDVALPHPRLRVVQARVLVRERPQRLGGDREGFRQDRELPAARRDHLTLDPDVVAEVHVALPGGERLLADPVQGDHDLEVAGAVPDRGEAELAPDAGQHDPAGDADAVAGRGVRRQVRVFLADLRDRGGAGESDRVGVGALGPDAGELIQAYLHLLGHVALILSGHLPEITGPA